MSTLLNFRNWYKLTTLDEGKKWQTANVMTPDDIEDALADAYDILKQAFPVQYRSPRSDAYVVPVDVFLQTVDTTAEELNTFLNKYQTRKSLNRPTYSMSMMKMPSQNNQLCVLIFPPDSH